MGAIPLAMTPPTAAIKAGQVRRSKGFQRVLVGHANTRGQHALWQWREGAWAMRKPRVASYIVARWPATESEGNPVPTTQVAHDWRAKYDNLLTRQAGLLATGAAAETSDMKILCKAKGEDWECDRAPTAAKGYCPGHYAQLRAEKPLAKLKGAHGALGVEMVTRAIQVPKEWDDLMVDAAGGPEGNVSAVYREAMAPHIDSLKQARRKS